MTLTLPLPTSRSNACIFAALLTIVWVAPGLAQRSEESQVKIADQPLAVEQLAICRAMLMSWFQGEKANVNLAEVTDPIDPNDASMGARCVKGLSLEAVSSKQSHCIRPEDLAQLGPFEFRLIDPKAGKGEVSSNDPGRAIQRGKPVDEAVENGFAHGLMTLGEIQFDKTHTHAVVSFSFVCGSLCGNGTTMLMEKKDGVWRKKAQCGGWVS
jgi:hypothetical protein